MPLRTPNNPTTDSTILAALKPVVLGLWGAGGVAQAANTQLAVASVANGGDATGADRVYIEGEYALFDAALFPAVNLYAGSQGYIRQSRRSFDGQMIANIDYYDQWSQGTRTFDQIRADLKADLERIKANIESNDSLTQDFTDYTLSTMRYNLSPYKGNIIEYDGKKLIFRQLQVYFNILTYDV